MSSASNSNNLHFVTKFFHSLPHLNMWFAVSNSTFDPNNSDYLETILFWTTIPILVLIFILLLLIIYACCLVCINKSTSIKINQSFNNARYGKLCKFKGLVWFFVLILSLLLGLLVFGSENFHHSFKNVTDHVRNFSSYFVKISNQTRKAQESIVYHTNTTLLKFEKDLRNSNYTNVRQTNDALKELNSIKSALNDSLRSLEYLRYFDTEKNAYFNLLQQIEMFEKTRWTIMLGVVLINTLLIILLIVGLIKNSKGSLCFFAFTGVLSLISIWILNAIYLGITVFIADYCTLPDQYVTTVAEKNHIKNLVQYFTTCQSPTVAKYGTSNPVKYVPFKQDLNRAESKLRTAAILYNENLIRISQSILGEQLLKTYNFTDAIMYTETLFDSIRSLTKCDQTSASYKSAVKVLCFNSIISLGIILAASILFGFIMPILICIIPQMWRRMHKKAYYSHNCGLAPSNVDESHPFIPLNTGNNPARSNISAARQFNESPSFQRLVTTINGPTVPQVQSNSNLNSLARNRCNNTSTMGRSINNQNMATTNTMNNYHMQNTNTNRVEDFVLNTDPYLMYKGLPSAPPQSSNYMQHDHRNNYFNTNSNSNSINVPIVLYPNSSTGTRTLSNQNKNYLSNTETLMKNSKKAAPTKINNSIKKERNRSSDCAILLKKRFY